MESTREKIRPTNTTGPLYRRIEDELRKRIRDGVWKPGDKLPSVRELCAEFDVSHITANRVLRDLSAAGLIERQTGRGNFLHSPVVPVEETRASRRKFDRLALVAPQRGGLNPLFDGYYSVIAEGIVRHAHDVQCDVRMSYLPREPHGRKSLLKEWLGTGVDGIIFLSVSGLCREAATLASQLKMPAVLVDSYLEGWPCVMNDTTMQALRITRALLDAGHRRVAYLGNNVPLANQTNEADRAVSFAATARELGLDLGERSMLTFQARPDELREVERWVEDQHVTALVFSVHSLFALLHEAWKQSEPRLLAKLSSVTFDTYPLLRYENLPKLTGTLSDLRSMGQIAFESLRHLIERGRRPGEDGGKKVAPFDWQQGETLQRAH